MTHPSLYSDHWPTPSPFRDGFRLKDRPLRVLSLGAGVQSTTLLLMSIRGELPRIDHAIFADTQSEPPAVYRHLAWLKEQCAGADIPLHTVTVGNLRQEAIAFRRNRVNRRADRKGYASIPLFVLNTDGSVGRIRRQCTAEYKIDPIERFIKRELIGLKHGERAPKTPVIEQWLGITTDEARRAKAPASKNRRDKSGRKTPVPIWWKVHAFPLMGVVKFWTLSDGGIFGRPTPIPHQQPHASGLSMSRADCIAWLRTHYPDIEVPRSACIECPYRNDEEWEAMKRNDPESFAIACNSDDAFRQAEADYQLRPETRAKLGRVVGTPFIHRSCRPLREIDFTATKPPQPVPEVDEVTGETLFGRSADTECEGMCGV